MIGVVIFALWMLCAVGAAGFTFAYFQGEYPSIAQHMRRTNLGMAVVIGVIGGPIALFVTFCFSGFGEHGWRLK